MHKNVLMFGQVYKTHIFYRTTESNSYVPETLNCLQIYCNNVILLCTENVSVCFKRVFVITRRLMHLKLFLT
jgi:hypothetical protein